MSGARRNHTALVDGGYEPVTMSGDLLAYIRRSPYGSLLIAVNFGSTPFELQLGSLGVQGRVILSTYLDREDYPTTMDVALRADEGVIVELTGPPVVV
jgi:alpha-glucosidase